ncbi:pyridoxal phosphate-dependent aminotransferase [Sphaerisporangium corydalis]|uniref:Pyridoxal phosphate-dependent aminotransferase n=1 Tax=Sphaerisporangium corydalis TaxID=1441875 RepID=A0ABV9E884_9ACTN|nr:pyridoxal phosphate-dependent aminotransferase [Sphaerisporangium corydalis]
MTSAGLLAPLTAERETGRLFDTAPRRRSPGLPASAHAAALRAADMKGVREEFHPGVDERTIEVYARARDAGDPFELRDLWLGRVEHELGPHSRRPELAGLWRASRVRRAVDAEEVLASRATVRFVKELFNSFFRDDLYGDLRGDAEFILSGGSVDERAWGLPDTLKHCLRFALDRDWYGYSDSRGRIPAREAVAAYENARIEGSPYEAGGVALTMGGTFAISTLADFVLLGAPATGAPALCGIPNYPPLVEAIARRRATRLVPLPSTSGRVDVDGLIAALTPATPLVMLQTAANPTGAGIAEEDLARLIRAASPSTIILLDECHEWLGASGRFSPLRASANVVRVSSLSKMWSAPGLKIGWILADPAFVESYYEHASTTFGGPPSFLYTLVEVLARMERWLVTGVLEPGAAEVAEFEGAYGLDPRRLRAAYQAYRHDRLTREAELTVVRDAALAGLTEASVSVVRPRYSINAAVDFPGWDDSYLCFRDVLRRTGVAVFPGVLTFCLSGGTVRVTTAQPWEDLSPAISRIHDAFTLTPGRR